MMLMMSANPVDKLNATVTSAEKATGDGEFERLGSQADKEPTYLAYHRFAIENGMRRRKYLGFSGSMSI